MVVMPSALLIILVEPYPISLWHCAALLGAGLGFIIPSSFTWVDSFMTVSGRFSSAYWTGYSVGYMVVPVFIGYLFNAVHPMWFVYVTLVCAVGIALTYVCLRVAVHTFKQPGDDVSDDVTISSQLDGVTLTRFAYLSKRF